MKLTRRLFVAAVIAAMATPALADDATLVYAAASMKNAMDAIVTSYTKSTGKEVKVSYGASGAMAKQIEQGAPADVFVTADEKWFGYVVDKKLVDGASRVTLAGNDLVVVTGKDSTFSYDGKDLAVAVGDGKLAVGEPKSVPCGAYTIEALGNLKQWDAVSPKAVYSDNVRAVLETTARGETVAGVVYTTDAYVEPRVKIVYTFDGATHKPIVYPAGLTTMAKPDAKPFFAYLTSDAAKAILKAQGFKVQ